MKSFGKISKLKCRMQCLQAPTRKAREWGRTHRTKVATWPAETQYFVPARIPSRPPVGFHGPHPAVPGSASRQTAPPPQTRHGRAAHIIWIWVSLLNLSRALAAFVLYLLRHIKVKRHQMLRNFSSSSLPLRNAENFARRAYICNRPASSRAVHSGGLPRGTRLTSPPPPTRALAGESVPAACCCCAACLPRPPWPVLARRYVCAWDGAL